jgi:hypothetical protein
MSLSNKYILLDARGTIIKVPVDIIKKSDFIKIWHESERKPDDAFYINCSPNETHLLLDEIFDYPQKTIRDYLLIHDIPKDNMYDKCILKWSKETKNNIRYLYTLKIAYIFNDKIMDIDLEYRYDEDENQYINNKKYYSKFYTSTGSYYVLLSSFFTVNLIMTVNNNILKIPANMDDITNAIHYCCKQNNQSLETYVETNKLYKINSKLHNQDPFYKGTIMLGNNGSIIHGNLLQNIINKYFIEICKIFIISPDLLNKMIGLLNNVVHVND